MSTEFYKSLTNKLIGECESRDLHTPDQISNFVTRAILVKYQGKHQLNIASIIADVFVQLNSGTKDLPDLPPSMAPAAIESPAFVAEVIEKSTELAKRYHEAKEPVTMDYCMADAKVLLGLTDEEGRVLRLVSDEDQTKLAKITTVTALVAAGENAPTLDPSVVGGMAPYVEAVKAGVPEY